MAWIIENIGSIIVIAVLLAIAALIVWGLVRRKKRGKSSCNCGGCNGNCGCCPMANIRKTEEEQ